MGIGEYASEFERLNNKVKAYDMVLREAVLAYKFLNNTSISDFNQKLIQAILTELSCDKMTHELKKVFGDLSLSISSNRVPSTYVRLESTEW